MCTFFHSSPVNCVQYNREGLGDWKVESAQSSSTSEKPEKEAHIKLKVTTSVDHCDDRERCNKWLSLLTTHCDTFLYSKGDS